MHCVLLRCTALLLLLVAIGSHGLKRKPRRFMDPIAQVRISPGAQSTKSRADAHSSTPTWKTKWYPAMRVDHFSYRNTLNFSLKYLTNYDSFKCGGPLFFYTGNEGDIEGFAMNTGIMWDLAPQFNAAVVFAEHRYYGQTMPFGNESYTSLDHLGYLSAIQALGDFANLIMFLKTDPSELGHCPAGTDIPVIAFGGSYGGMLTAWFREKYPQLVNGAWASSAPILYVEGTGIPPYRMDAITTQIYVDSGCDWRAFSKGFAAIERLSKTADGLKTLNEIFHTEPGHGMQNASEFMDLYYYIFPAIFYMAMIDYPYPANFLQSLPQFPVKYVCQFAKTAPASDEELARQLYNVINVYYNYTGKLPYNCFTSNCEQPQISSQTLDLSGDGWPWQTCTSMTLQECDMGGNVDFFLNTCNLTGGLVQAEIESCEHLFKKIHYPGGLYDLYAIPRRYGITFAGASNTIFSEIHYPGGLYDLYAIPRRYGITFAGASNTIFSNGNLDPWSGGGVYEDTPGIQRAMQNGVYIFYMKDAAHHLDLRTPNTCDPPSVVYARFQMVNILKCWVNSSCTTPPKFYRLPDNSGWTVPPSDQCKYINQGYPWGQAYPKGSWHLQSSTFLTSMVALFAIIRGYLSL